MPGLTDAFEAFQPGPAHEIRERVFLPAAAALPEPRVGLADAARAQMSQVREQRFVLPGAEVVKPLVEKIGAKARIISPYTSFCTCSAA